MTHENYVKPFSVCSVYVVSIAVLGLNGRDDELREGFYEYYCVSM